MTVPLMSSEGSWLPAILKVATHFSLLTKEKDFFSEMSTSSNNNQPRGRGAIKYNREEEQEESNWSRNDRSRPNGEGGSTAPRSNVFDRVERNRAFDQRSAPSGFVRRGGRNPTEEAPRSSVFNRVERNRAPEALFSRTVEGNEGGRLPASQRLGNRVSRLTSNVSQSSRQSSSNTSRPMFDQGYQRSTQNQREQNKNENPKTVDQQESDDNLILLQEQEIEQKQVEMNLCFDFGRNPEKNANLLVNYIADFLKQIVVEGKTFMPPTPAVKLDAIPLEEKEKLKEKQDTTSLKALKTDQLQAEVNDSNHQIIFDRFLSFPLSSKFKPHDEFLHYLKQTIFGYNKSTWLTTVNTFFKIIYKKMLTVEETERLHWEEAPYSDYDPKFTKNAIKKEARRIPLLIRIIREQGPIHYLKLQTLFNLVIQKHNLNVKPLRMLESEFLTFLKHREHIFKVNPNGIITNRRYGLRRFIPSLVHLFNWNSKKLENKFVYAQLVIIICSFPTAFEDGEHGLLPNFPIIEESAEIQIIEFLREFPHIFDIVYNKEFRTYEKVNEMQHVWGVEIRPEAYSVPSLWNSTLVQSLETPGNIEVDNSRIITSVGTVCSFNARDQRLRVGFNDFENGNQLAFTSKVDDCFANNEKFEIHPGSKIFVQAVKILGAEDMDFRIQTIRNCINNDRFHLDSYPSNFCDLSDMDTENWEDFAYECEVYDENYDEPKEKEQTKQEKDLTWKRQLVTSEVKLLNALNKIVTFEKKTLEEVKANLNNFCTFEELLSMIKFRPHKFIIKENCIFHPSKFIADALEATIRVIADSPDITIEGIYFGYLKMGLMKNIDHTAGIKNFPMTPTKIIQQALKMLDSILIKRTQDGEVHYTIRGFYDITSMIFVPHFLD